MDADKLLEEVIKVLTQDGVKLKTAENVSGRLFNIIREKKQDFIGNKQANEVLRCNEG